MPFPAGCQSGVSGSAAEPVRPCRLRPDRNWYLRFSAAVHFPASDPQPAFAAVRRHSALPFHPG